MTQLSETDVRQLTGGMDTRLHHHLEDRVPTHETLRELQKLFYVDNVSTNTTLNERYDIALVDTSAGSVTLSLPPARTGKEFRIVKTTAANSVVLAPYLSETIDGAATFSWTSPWTAVTIKELNGNWSVLGSHAWRQFPNIQVRRTTSQALGAADTPTRIGADTTDYAFLCANDPTDGITVETTGRYNYQFSLQLANSDTAAHDAVFWLRKNGSDIVGTGSIVTVPAKHGSTDGHILGACNFFVPLSAGDHVELWWASNSTNLSLLASAAQVSPYAHPSAPAAAITLTYVSEV